MISILLDIGNIIFFISNFPQMMNAYKNRRNLKGLSILFLLGISIATIIFIIISVLTFAPFTFAIGWLEIFFYLCQVYWKMKYK